MLGVTNGSSCEAIQSTVRGQGEASANGNDVARCHKAADGSAGKRATNGGTNKKSPDSVTDPPSKRSRSRLPGAMEEGGDQEEGTLARQTSKAADLTDHATLQAMPLTVVIFGATGELARKKLLPSLYQLCVLGLLPRDLTIVACSRSRNERAAFVAKQLALLEEDARLSKDDFAARVVLHAGPYDAPDTFVSLASVLAASEKGEAGNRLFYCATPTSAYTPIAELVSAYARAGPSAAPASPTCKLCARGKSRSSRAQRCG